MSLPADTWAAIGAIAAWALVFVTIAAVIVGAQAAYAANQTFRLEAEPRLIVRFADEARVYAREWSFFRLPAHVRTTASTPVVSQTDVSEIDATCEPVYFVGGRENADGQRIIVNGFDLFVPPEAVLWSPNSEAGDLREGVRIEIKNLGRSPAIQVGLRWKIGSSILSSAKHAINGSALGSRGVDHKSNESIIVVDGIGPNHSAFIWFVNATGTAFNITFVSAFQRDPFNPSSSKSVPIPAFATSRAFKLPPNVGGRVPGVQMLPASIPDAGPQ